MPDEKIQRFESIYLRLYFCQRLSFPPNQPLSFSAGGLRPVHLWQEQKGATIRHAAQ